MKWLRVAGLLALVLAVPAQAKDKKKKPGTPVVEADDLFQAGQKLSGKVVVASDTAVRLRMEFERLELKQPNATPKANGNRQLQELLRQQQQIARAQQKIATARNPRERMQAIQNLQRQMATQQVQALRKELQARGNAARNSPFKIVKDVKDVDVDLDDSVTFRTSFLPFQYDDMGNPKKLTTEEMKELKGDPRLPGYKARVTDAKPGAMVTVTLSKNKETDAKLRGTLVLITAEGADPAPKGKGGKK